MKCLVKCRSPTASTQPWPPGHSSYWSFPDPADPGVVTTENLTSSLSLDDSGDFRQYAQTFGFLQAAALGPRESADMLSMLAGQA